MFALIVGIAKFLLLFTIWLVLVLALVAYTKTAIGYFWPHTVQIGTFADINDGSKDLSGILISRAEELGRPISFDALFEVKVPPIKNNFAIKADLDFLDNTKLSFQGVDVPAVIRAFMNALPDNHYTITANPSNVGEVGPVLNLRFRAPSGSSKTWLLRVERSASGVSALSSAAATGQVIDRAIYTIWYYMYYDRNGLRWRGNLEANFTSARTLEAYYGGQQRLASYQRTFQASDLDEAEKEFRLLTSEMPQYVPGWMLLGMTLLEERSERDAIRAFDRVQQLLAPEGELRAGATSSDQRIWLQSRLFSAVARRKMYDWRDNHQALRILEALIHEIPDKRAPTMSRQDFYDLSKIRFSVMFQIAHTVGHDLVLLKENNFVDALTDSPDAVTGTSSTVPKSVRPPEDVQITLREHVNALRNATNVEELAKAKAQLGIDFGNEINRIFERQQTLVKDAENWLTNIDAMMNQSTAAESERLDKQEWEHAREGLKADLRNADGYARFRYAQIHEANDKQFRERCRDALGKLIKAQVINPNEYTIIQNMGLIYGDPRYDPEGKELDAARALFIRSLEIKSRDYYGYQKLATLAIRQAYERGPEFFSLDQIKVAIAQAEKARELRPGNGTIFTLLAQLYTLKWTKTTGSDQQDAASLINAALAMSQTGDRASPIHVWTAELQWQLARLRATANKDDFTGAKTKLLGKLHMIKESTDGDPRWNARDLHARATNLGAALNRAEFEDRVTLRWPN